MNLADYLDTYSNTNTVDWSSIGPALAKLGIGQNGRDGSAGWQFNNNIESGNPGWTLSPGARESLQGWSVGDPRLQGDTRTQQISDASGANVGSSSEDVSQNFFWDQLMPGLIAGGTMMAGLPIIGGALGGGMLGGAGAGGLLGAGTAAAQGNDIGKGAMLGGIGGGISGYMSNVPATGDVASSVAGVPGEAQQAVDAYANSGMPDVMQGMPDIGGAQSFPVAPQTAPSWMDAMQGENVAALDKFAQQPMQMPMPEWQQATAPSWLDAVRGETEAGLQQASQQTPAQVNSTMPDVSAIPTTLPTTGLDPMRQQELAGYQTNGTMPSPAVPTGAGGLLGDLKGIGGGALDWMKANPGLGKLLLGGAGALLGGAGGATGGAAPKAYGAPAQWKNAPAPMSQGLLGGGQMGGQSAGYPKALGLMGGQQNAGAWRFLGG